MAIIEDLLSSLRMSVAALKLVMLWPKLLKSYLEILRYGRLSGLSR